MKLVTIIIGLLILPAMAYYQKLVEIRGVVIDAIEKTPLVDSHVYIQGTNIGTITNGEGRFELQVPLLYIHRPLIVSFVGFANFEKKISEIQRDGVQISLQPDVIALDEIVITPGKELLVDQAIDKVMINYEDTVEMLSDFYLALFALDKDNALLKKVYQNIDKN